MKKHLETDGQPNLKSYIRRLNRILPPSVTIESCQAFGYRMQAPANDYSQLEGVSFANLLFDPKARALYDKESKSLVKIAVRGIALLDLFTRQPGKIFHARLVADAIGCDYDSVRVEISRLNKKLNNYDAKILSKNGGYYLPSDLFSI